MDRRNAAPMQGCPHVGPVDASADNLCGHEYLDSARTELNAALDSGQLMQGAVHRFDSHAGESNFQVLHKLFNTKRLINKDHSWPIGRLAQDLAQLDTTLCYPDHRCFLRRQGKVIQVRFRNHVVELRQCAFFTQALVQLLQQRLVQRARGQESNNERIREPLEEASDLGVHCLCPVSVDNPVRLFQNLAKILYPTSSQPIKPINCFWASSRKVALCTSTASQVANTERVRGGVQMSAGLGLPSCLKCSRIVWTAMPGLK